MEVDFWGICGPGTAVCMVIFVACTAMMVLNPAVMVSCIPHMRFFEGSNEGLGSIERPAATA